MKSRFFRSFIIVVLSLAFIMSVGCDNVKESILKNNSDYVQEIFEEYELTNLTSPSPAAFDHINITIQDDIQEAFDDYNVDFVDTIYLSQEYVEELDANSKKNVYFGYDFDEVASAMEGTNWTFTVENGQTFINEVAKQSDALANIVRKVAIGTGVILICVVVSSISAGVGAAPVACFFAGAAKSALIGSISGAAVSGVIGAAIAGIQTHNFEEAINSAASAAADGFMWGAISGALIGGFSSTACFSGETLVRTETGYKPISEITVGERVHTYNEYAGSYEYQPVTKVMKKTANDIVNLFVGGTKIVTTSTHPIYTPDGWIEAQNLTTNSLVLTKDGYKSLERVERIDQISNETWVYNLTTQYTHTYTVSNQDVVVHNACGDSARLRKNLIDAGDTVPSYPNAAHHIIPSSDMRYAQAIQARDKLLSFGIDINDSCNGVFLSTSKNVLGTTYHRSIHTAEYYSKVNSLLSTATTKSEALDVLSYIKTQLLNGTF